MMSIDYRGKVVIVTGVVARDRSVMPRRSRSAAPGRNWCFAT